MPFGTSYITKTLRLHPIENHVFDKACEALGGLERAQLMQEAVLAEAFRLGIRFSAEPPPPLRGAWPYLPDRSDEPTEIRVSISMRVTVAELMSMAAEHVKASEPLFIIGATMAYVGRLQHCYQGAHASSPEDARESRAALRKIRLPEQYRYPRQR
ncbi:MAG TPA: hypothetical protein VFP65_05935 [Anaeromyxobacteraceae bacterium]|nr:hypothetical protein [Anaeromyxobacteraceae bacterium]